MKAEREREKGAAVTAGRGSSSWVHRWETPGVLPQAGLPLRKWSPGQLRNQIISSFSHPHRVSVCLCVRVCVWVGGGYMCVFSKAQVI